MAAINTALTALFPGLHAPIVLAPMAGAAGGRLAATVSRAGGLGFLAAGYLDRAAIEAEMREANSVLGGADAPLGVNLLTWKLTQNNNGVLPSADTSSDTSPSKALDTIDCILEHKPQAIWLAFGEQLDMREWCAYVQRRASQLGVQPLLFVTANTEKEAQLAVEEWGADVLVVQGIEAGGHGLGAAPPLATLVRAVASALPQWKPNNSRHAKPPLLGAGGIADGAGVAATLALGADGAVVGTRFILTPESLYKDEQKQLLLGVSAQDTVRSYAFDDARGTLGWPAGIDGRGLRGPLVTAYDSACATHGAAPGTLVPGIEERQQRYRDAAAAGDTSSLVTWAGAGVGLATSIDPAAEVLATLIREAVAALRQAAQSLAP